MKAKTAMQEAIDKIEELVSIRNFQKWEQLKKEFLEKERKQLESYASQPMSAEQVELLEASKIALHTLDCIEFTRGYGTASKRLESAISKFTAPTVKAEGWFGIRKSSARNKC